MIKVLQKGEELIQEASNVVASIVKDTGKSKAEVEKFWKKAKQLTKDKFNVKSEDDFSDKHWSYVTGITKKMAGVETKERNMTLSKAYVIENVIIPKGSKIIVVEQPVVEPKEDPLVPNSLEEIHEIDMKA